MTIIRADSKILLIRAETTYGIDPAPAAATHAVLAENIKLWPQEGVDDERRQETPWIAAPDLYPGAMHAKIEFEMDAVGLAAGTPPAVGLLLRACGAAQTILAGVSVTYNPISDGFESVAIYLWIGPTRYVLLGAHGTWELMMPFGKRPKFKFTMTGLYTRPTDQTRPAPTLNAVFPRVASTANTGVFTLNSVALPLHDFTMKLGADVKPVFGINSERIGILDRQERVDMKIRAQPLATTDIFAAGDSRFRLPLVLTHGPVGSRWTLSVPLLQILRIPEIEYQDRVKMWSVGGTPLANAGSDQWTLVFS